MPNKEQSQVDILQTETVDGTTLVMFKHKDKELYAVKTESFLKGGLFDRFWEVEERVVTTLEDAKALFIKSLEAEKSLKSRSHKYSEPPNYESLDEKILQLYFGNRNSPDSEHLREICSSLADLSYSPGSSNKYFLIEPLILAIRKDLDERLWELSGIDSGPVLPSEARARCNQETQYVKGLHESLAKALYYLYELRQMGTELR
ncbi:MAG: hypothetical protein ACR2LR_17090 [Hassallia sp.]